MSDDGKSESVACPPGRERNTRPLRRPKATVSEGTASYGPELSDHVRVCPSAGAGSGRGEAETGSMSDTPPPEETGLEYQSSEGSFAEGS